MAKVLGLGGVFFKCANVESYRAWWAQHMNVDVKAWGSMEWDSDGEARTMMSPFASGSTYLMPSAKDFMINLRVDDVRALLDRARIGGATILGDVEETEYGIFGWFLDPEGIKLSLIHI